MKNLHWIGMIGIGCFLVVTSASPIAHAEGAKALASRAAATDSSDDEAQPTTRRNSTGMMVTGIVLTGLGATLLATGLFTLMSARSCDGSDATCNDLGGAVQGTFGAALTLSGVAMTAVGLPLLIIGAKRVPNDDHESEARLRRTAATSLTAELTVGPTSLGLSGTF